jgi:DNA repair protein RadC
LTSLRLVRERDLFYGQAMTTPDAVYGLLRPLMEHLAQEAFFVVGVNTRNHVVLVHQIGLGGPDSVMVCVADIAKVLLLANATGAIISHNHPSSGEVTPSPEDERLTTRVRDALTLLGIRFLDHVIVGDGKYYSFSASG